MAKTLFLRVRELLSDRRGTVAVVTAVALTAMLGVAGLGTEATMWYVAKRDMQGAADAAAYTAASAEAAGQNSTNFKAAGDAVAAQWGFTNGTDQVTVAVNNPPTTGNYTSNSQAIEVVVTQPQQLLFAQLFMASAPNISARAVAVASSDTGPCLVALDGSSTQAGLTASGSAQVNLSSCDLDVNASGANAVNLSGSGTEVSVLSANVVGTYTPSGGAAIDASDGVTTDGHAAADPYSSVSIPTSSGNCLKGSAPLGSGTLTVATGTVSLAPPSSGTACTIPGAVQALGGTLDLAPGVYIVDGNLSVLGSATISGTGGVTIILTKNTTTGTYGTMDQSTATSTIDITAPTSGPTAGVAIYQDRNAPNSTYSAGNCSTGCNDISGSSSQDITGAIYFPSQNVAYAGNSSTTSPCTQLVAYTMNFSGTVNFNSRCSGTGVAGLGSATTALVE